MFYQVNSSYFNLRSMFLKIKNFSKCAVAKIRDIFMCSIKITQVLAFSFCFYLFIYLFIYFSAYLYDRFVNEFFKLFEADQKDNINKAKKKVN